MSESMSVRELTQILEHLPGATFCSRMDPVTMQTTWLYRNKRAAEVWGVDEEELEKNPFAALDPLLPEDRARCEAIIAQAVQAGTPMTYAGRIKRRDGQIRWTETHANVMHEEGGKVLWYGQTFDVTERKTLEQSLADSEAERAKSEVLYREVIDALPVGVMVMDQTRAVKVMNSEQRRYVGGLVTEDGGRDVSNAYGIFMADGVTPLPTEDTGMARGLRGETLDEEVVIRNPRIQGDVRLHVTWTPLRDAHGVVYAALGTAQDITLQRQLEMELRSRNEELGASEAAKAQLIDRLRYSIDELSNPILEVWEDVLAMPIIGVVDSRRTADMVQRLLSEVTRTQASFVIIDLTGVEIVDTKTADHLMKLMRKVEIVGARCVLTGIRPAVAETLVDIGVDFGRLATLRNLRAGLREALRFAKRQRRGDQDIDLGDDDDEAQEKKRGR